jgi:alkane 1-monooxygenase
MGLSDMLPRAIGYLSILIPPALIPLSLMTGMPALAFVGLVLFAPLLRAIFGDVISPPPEWTEWLASLLEWVPVTGALLYIGGTVAALRILHSARAPNGTLAWFGSSLWAVYLFGSCVAHELVHRSDALSRNIGRVLSGLIGYPLLEHEHRAHHMQNGDADAAECARLDESVWAFTFRRLAHVVSKAREGDMLMAARRGHRLAGGLPLSLAATLATAIGFAWAAGPAGLVMYSVVACAVAWAIQAITYIQHWGLGGDRLHDVQVADLGWEDHCKLQSWLTLGISFHQAHHRSSSVPYYRLQPTQDSPKAPAGYIVLFFASLVPPVWRALMVPALLRWQRAPLTQRTAGRSLLCLKLKDG